VPIRIPRIVLPTPPTDLHAVSICLGKVVESMAIVNSSAKGDHAGQRFTRLDADAVGHAFYMPAVLP